jgi:hypothetical protein
MTTDSRHEAPKSQAERAAAIIAEQEREERRAEKVAKRLNEQQFKAPALPPPRRSVRSTQGKAPSRFADEQEVNRRKSNVNDITDNCRHHQHRGFGCAALKANHLPDYFDSMENVNSKISYNANIYVCIFSVDNMPTLQCLLLQTRFELYEMLLERKSGFGRASKKNTTTTT